MVHFSELLVAVQFPRQTCKKSDLSAGVNLCRSISFPFVPANIWEFYHTKVSNGFIQILLVLSKAIALKISIFQGTLCLSLSASKMQLNRVRLQHDLFNCI